jgi:neural Wiskott-Aldrich syndrome protein
MTAAIAEEFGRIPMSPFLKATLARAADYASAQQHREVTLEHLLLALAEDPEASVVLKSSQVDIQRLMSDVSSFIGRNDDRVDGAIPAAAAISNDLRRILEASAAAASQGRRREINGAIVLAAIVGDGKSPSAHMLRSQGLTFEQAIRALQQAAAAPAPRPGPPSQQQPQTSNEPTAPAPRAATTDDILASARERVLSRTGPPDAAAAEKIAKTSPPAIPIVPLPAAPRPAHEATEPALEPPAPAPAAAAPARAPAVDPIAGRMAQGQDQTVEQPEQRHESAPSPMSFPRGGQLGSAQATQQSQSSPRWAPPPSPVPQQGQPPPAPVPSPMARPAPPAQSPFPPMHSGMRAPVGSPAPMPPFPPMNSAPGGAQGAPQPYGQPPQGARPAGPPQPAPWSDAGGPRGPHYDEAMARLDARRRQGPPGQGGAQAPLQQRRPGNTTVVQAGKLVENIPRKMRVGIPVIVEARVARAEVKAIADGLQGDGAVFHHEITVTKAMSVRLRAPDGGFYIETASPETQWIENVLGLMSNDYASWRWSVTARDSGKKRLQLVISARTVGTDGLAAETALPDQVVEVRVGINYAQTFLRWAGWITAAVIGGVLARFGETIFEFAKAMLGSSA